MLIHDLEEKMPNDIKVTGERNAELLGTDAEQGEQRGGGSGRKGPRGKGGAVCLPWVGYLLRPGKGLERESVP